MSESDSAESSSSNDELAADSREASVVEALDPARIEPADDAWWDSDNPHMRSIASESEHDGNGHAELAETDSHDTADMNIEKMMRGE